MLRTPIRYAGSIPDDWQIGRYAPEVETFGAYGAFIFGAARRWARTGYFTQASTLSGLAAIHFFAASSADILFAQTDRGRHGRSDRDGQGSQLGESQHRNGDGKHRRCQPYPESRTEPGRGVVPVASSTLQKYPQAQRERDQRACQCEEAEPVEGESGEHRRTGHQRERRSLPGQRRPLVLGTETNLRHCSEPGDQERCRDDRHDGRE